MSDTTPSTGASNSSNILPGGTNSQGFARDRNRARPEGPDRLIADIGSKNTEPRKRRGMRVKSYDAVPGARELQRLSRAVEESRLRVPIAAAYRLADAAKAHRRIAKGHLLGKIVLRVR